MSKIKLFYNSSCSDCAKLAVLTKKLDWLKRVDISTEVPASGELEPGEIAVFEYATSKYFTGVYATRKVSLNVPAYFLYGLLLFFPSVRKAASKGKVGCNGDTCSL